MRIPILVIFFLLSIACNKHNNPSTGNSTSAGNSSGGSISLSTMNADILSLVNQYRSSKKLSSLQMSSAASEQALQHSKNMASNKVPFGHNGFSTRISKIESKIGPVKMAGENVAYGRMTAKQVMDGWIKSKVHRENLEGNFNQIGIGVAQGSGGTIYYTQIFIQK